MTSTSLPTASWLAVLPLAMARGHDPNNPHTSAAFESVGSASIKVASSSLARELFTRLDTCHLCSTSLAAGLSNSTPALPVSHCPSRKSYPRVAMMQSGQDWYGDDGPRSLDGPS
jgi:hypothetical protein